MSDYFLYIFAFMAGMAGALLIRLSGSRLRLIDYPNRRSSHSLPTPKGGGIGLLCAFVAASLAMRISPFFWMPAAVLSLISLAADRLDLSPGIRLILQFLAALVFLSGTAAGQLGNIWAGNIWHLLFMLPLSIFIVGSANFYNFMDGIDGIAAIAGIIGFFLLALYLTVFQIDGFHRVLCVCMLCACFGFLPLNFPKAKVFMGDTGSVLLGFLFAEMVVDLSVSSWAVNSVVTADSLTNFICLAHFLFPFYADEITTMVVRLKDGDNLMRPHRKHLYQILANDLKVPHWKVSTGYGILQLIAGLSLILLKSSGIIIVSLLLLLLWGGFIGGTYYVRSLKLP